MVKQYQVENFFFTGLVFFKYTVSLRSSWLIGILYVLVLCVLMGYPLGFLNLHV